MSGEKNPRMYDSMAQAYHLIGKHEEAAQAQEIAIHLLGDSDEALKAVSYTHLTLPTIYSV